jgi:serine/threonine protein kinase
MLFLRKLRLPFGCRSFSLFRFQSATFVNTLWNLGDEIEVNGAIYQVGALTSEHGVAAVYAARDKATQTPVLIWTLRASCRAQPSAWSELERMGVLASRLSHPAFPKVYASGVLRGGSIPPMRMPLPTPARTTTPHLSGNAVSGLPYWISEFVVGRSISELVRGGPLSPFQALAIGAEVASVLGYLGQRRLVQRQLHPDNVLLLAPEAHHPSPAPRSVVLLGLDALGSENEKMPPARALQYVAPEQLRDERATLSANVFALGVILFESLTANHPFSIAGGFRATETWVRTSLEQRFRKPPTSLDAFGAFSPALTELISRMLAQDPAQRPVFQELEALFRDALATERAEAGTDKSRGESSIREDTVVEASAHEPEHDADERTLVLPPLLHPPNPPPTVASAPPIVVPGTQTAWRNAWHRPEHVSTKMSPSSAESLSSARSVSQAPSTSASVSASVTRTRSASPTPTWVYVVVFTILGGLGFVIARVMMAWLL